MGHYNSFLVRVWVEEGKNVIRGHIQHVGTREAFHFLEWEKMVDFILNHLSWQVNGTTEDELWSLTNDFGESRTDW